MARAARSARRRRACASTLIGVLTFGCVTLAATAPALACGGLVGENGTIQLAKTTTLAAYHDGVERYVTSFEFSGEGSSVGSLVPLPDVPSTVERGGNWTLQRLAREVAPPRTARNEAAAGTAASADSAEVLLETQIDALDITILKGGGSEVGVWAKANGFFLTPDAPEVLDFYADRSPIFMAAKFDVARAKQLQQRTGQGTPIMLTIPTSEPWVPLRILGLGLDGAQNVQADVFLLNDTEPQLLAGGKGLQMDRSEPASALLLSDLRSDKGMEWVPQSMWLSYLKVDADAADLKYDLAVSSSTNTLPSIQRAGIPEPETRVIAPPSPTRVVWPVALGLTFGVATVALIVTANRRRRDRVAGPGPAGTGSGPGLPGALA